MMFEGFLKFCLENAYEENSCKQLLLGLGLCPYNLKGFYSIIVLSCAVYTKPSNGLSCTYQHLFLYLQEAVFFTRAAAACKYFNGLC